MLGQLVYVFFIINDAYYLEMYSSIEWHVGIIVQSKNLPILKVSILLQFAINQAQTKYIKIMFTVQLWHFVQLISVFVYRYTEYYWASLNLL